MNNNNDDIRSILVVEDDERVLDLAVNIFDYAGYNVLAANDAAAGIDCFRQHPEIDLIFCDLILPGGVSGMEMATAIMKEKPDALFLMVSGYSDKGQILRQMIEDMDNIEFIAKPYDVNEVTTKVRAMISQHSPATGVA